MHEDTIPPLLSKIGRLFRALACTGGVENYFKVATINSQQVCGRVRKRRVHFVGGRVINLDEAVHASVHIRFCGTKKRTVWMGSSGASVHAVEITKKFKPNARVGML